MREFQFVVLCISWENVKQLYKLSPFSSNQLSSKTNAHHDQLILILFPQTFAYWLLCLKLISFLLILIMFLFNSIQPIPNFEAA